jgi:hypothetical protein
VKRTESNAGRVYCALLLLLLLLLLRAAAAYDMRRRACAQSRRRTVALKKRHLRLLNFQQIMAPRLLKACIWYFNILNQTFICFYSGS